MTNLQICPPHDQLHEYARGDRDSAEIDQHLDECPTCRQEVETLVHRDSDLNRFLRPLDATPTPADPALARLKQQVLAIPSSSRAVELRVGMTVGDYELKETLGTGGLGVVYKAWHRRLKRMVALKTVAGSVQPTAEMAALFRREMEVLARLTHPNVVVAHDAFDGEAGTFLVMELIEGKSLDQWVRDNGAPRVEQALEIMLQAARGLAFAHEAGIVHRDVKPSNLMLDATNTVKILDLGLARRTLRDPSMEDALLTGGSHVMGTPAYMAPEQSLDARQADERSDIYALGCTLYTLMTGQTVYQAETPLAMVVAHREKPIPSIRAVRPDCPASLDTLFQRMITKKPERRPASMKEVLAELERIQRGARLPHRRGILIAATVAAAVLVGVVASPLLAPSKADPKASPDPKAAPVPVVEEPKKPPLVELVRIEPGKFFMGSADEEKEAQPEEKPRHEVRITRAFLLGKFEVTQEQYQEIMGANPSSFSPKGRAKDQLKDLETKRYPVESISWNDAVAFCNRLSERHGFEPYYRVEKNTVTVRGTNGYRLPTEAEWEYACRAGSDTRWSFGSDARDLDAHTWHAGNANETTHPVGVKKPNAWGLHDMHGNVPEWCWDRYDARYYQKSPVSDPPGAGTGSTRSYRGGGWNGLGMQMRSASRNTLGTAYSVLTVVGMRVARDP